MGCKNTHFNGYQFHLSSLFGWLSLSCTQSYGDNILLYHMYVRLMWTGNSTAGNTAITENRKGKLAL